MADYGLCKGCAFWMQFSDNPHEGECRRYPPAREIFGWSPYIRMQSAWPQTSEDDGCGECNPRPKQQMKVEETEPAAGTAVHEVRSSS